MKREEFYSTLQEWHKQYVPTLRFGQFMTAFFDWYKKFSYGNDCFYMEDVSFLHHVDIFLTEVLKVKKEGN